MCYTAQQICAQVAHLIMQLKYKANTHCTHTHTQREKGQTKWLASQKAVHNVICIYILARAPCKIRKEIMQQMPPGNTQLPFYTPFYPLAISILSFLLSLSLGCASAFLRNMHNFKHVIRERALRCASSVGSAPLVGVPEIFVITAITKSRNQRQKQKGFKKQQRRTLQCCCHNLVKLKQHLFLGL